MEPMSPKQLQTCRRLTLLSVCIYVISLPLPAIQQDGSDAMTGFGIFLWFPICCIHAAAWANLTLALGWYGLLIGNVFGAATMGATSLALAASCCIGPITGIDGLQVGYWVWVGSMVVVLTAPLFVRAYPNSVAAE